MKIGLATVILIVGLTGCATNPQKIAPSYVSDQGYSNLECEQLAREQARLGTVLAAECDSQYLAYMNDMAGVFFIGLPVASMGGGDRGYEIARLKGEIKALESVAAAKNCGLKPLPAWSPPKPQPPADTGEMEAGKR